MESNLPVIGVYALVGGAGLKLEELAEGVMAAMERGEGIGLGFYDWGIRLRRLSGRRSLRMATMFGRFGGRRSSSGKWVPNRICRAA